MRKILFLLCVAVLSSSILSAETPKKEPVSPVPAKQGLPDGTKYKEYIDAVVALIDPSSGAIGVTWYNEETKKEEKLSLKVNPDTFGPLEITNTMNQDIEFSDIAAGDHVDIVTSKNEHGEEGVIEIVDDRVIPQDEG